MSLLEEDTQRYRGGGGVCECTGEVTKKRGRGGGPQEADMGAAVALVGGAGGGGVRGG